MNIPLKKTEKENPGLRQSQASDPLKSVWVGASAGTGKTKVLIDRVLRLMLPRNGLPRESATPPGKILCLTFTKTAAAEMSNRIYERLSGWSVKGDDDLRKELRALIGQEPSREVEEEARRLFARVLDVPGGLKIMTIHSFCQSILKRFPVEAGLPPHFELMDEQSAVEYLTKCLHGIIAEARENPALPLAQSFNRLALYMDGAAMSDLMQQIMSKRSLLASILKHHGDAEGTAEKTIEAVYRDVGVDQKTTEEDILARAARMNPDDEKDLRLVLAALLNGSKKDLEKAERIQPWLENPASRVKLFDFYCRGYFTQDGDVYSTLATKKSVDACPDIIDIMQREAARLEVFRQELCALRLVRLNAALLTVASAMVGRYTQYKRYRDRLDFDDLIIKACDLLSEENMVPWVLFKLDEGIDHILVDEAQDTSRNQWRVVEALSREFFSGLGSRENIMRTLFVVGDEKQSIFSFQGADPYEFARMQSFFGNRVTEIQDGWEIFLEYSFRSTATVLEVVDSVFSLDATRKGVVFDLDRPVRHLAFREGHAGLVELWPLFKTAKKEKPDPWQLPTEVDGGDNAASRLADKIATTIRGWLDNKEILASKGRPVRAGDILVLVRSRGVFVDLLMRALKSHDVPVAGIDRMNLPDEIAVMDLMALAQFALLPKDDLTLASLLKSPLVGISEDELYHLCHGRTGALWPAVQQLRPDIASFLQGWVRKAGSATPYAFFAEALTTPCFADKVSGRRAFYSRLGYDIQDALDEFLNACLHYEQTHTPSLQKFVDWFARGEAEIKREQDAGKTDLVRIMTVHASKGLQAPVVFLPDTVTKPEDSPRSQVRLVWPEDEKGVPLWSPRQEFSAPAYAARAAEARDRQEEEYRRLLYVALTRAEDRLYIAGHHGVRSPKADCWYNLIANAFPQGAEDVLFEIEGETEIFTARRLHHPQKVAAEKGMAAQPKSNTARQPLPSWAFALPPEEPFPLQPLSPSRPDDEEPATKGPLAADDSWKFQRGNIMHKILQILPQMDEAKREKALLKHLARSQLNIPPDAQKSFAEEIMAVLRHPEFAPIFGVGSRAEVPIVGVTGKKILSGQMDRILVTKKEVLIIDYKTNRPPPKRVEDVATIYLKQMAAYAASIHNIYPKHEIKCALLWTDGPALMPISQKMLDPYIP